MTPLNRADELGRKLEQEAKARNLGRGTDEQSARRIRSLLGTEGDVDSEDTRLTHPEVPLTPKDTIDESSDRNDDQPLNGRETDGH